MTATPHPAAFAHVRETVPGVDDFDTTHSATLRQYQRVYGLLPPAVEDYPTQAARCLKQLALKATPIEKYNYLSQLRNSNTHLFYRLAIDHMKELTPLIYTPVVGEACQKWSEIYTQPEGMYLSWADKGHIASVLHNWPASHVEITVVTDGSRILGLGDLGINGMGIPIGKLALYSACGGIQPDATLPLTIDLGTSNEQLRNDPLYMGSRRPKVTAEEEAAFLDELMEALVARWPGIVIQFEDWKNPFPSLEKYGGKYTMFNDDIQGTGAVILAGMINAVKRAGTPIRDHRAVLMGAGSAAVGVAKQIVQFFMNEGLTEDEARRCFYLVDTKGMVTLDRGDKLAEHKVYFARDDNNGQQLQTLEQIVDHVRPTILMGLSTIGGCFTPSILSKVGEWNTSPIIFPLSNPSANSECTFAEAMQYTQGRALFASGSPFNPEMINGTLHSPGQGNNMYVFPGIGLGAILSKATVITQDMIYASGAALADSLTPEEVQQGWLYPDLSRIRQVSGQVTLGVIRAAQKAGVDREVRIRDLNDQDLLVWIRERMYDPHAETGGLEKEVQSLFAAAHADDTRSHL